MRSPSPGLLPVPGSKSPGATVIGVPPEPPDIGVSVKSVKPVRVGTVINSQKLSMVYVGPMPRISKVPESEWDVGVGKLPARIAPAMSICRY